MTPSDPSPHRALLLEGIHSEAMRVLEARGLQVQTVEGALAETELIEALEGASVLGIRSRSRITRRVLEAAEHLEVVGAFCIGTNQIDLEACLQAGVPVFNAPYANTRSVVELALAEVILLLRNVLEKNELLHRGIWKKSAHRAREVRGKRLGIVGYGNIGAQLSVLAEAVGMEVLYYDVVEKLPLGNARPCASLHSLLAQVDAVSVHVDGSPENDGLFGAEEFAIMREGAVFVNLARGSVVDVHALKEALESGRVGGAALDVFPREPQRTGFPFDSPLQGMPNVLLTPHIGGSTQEAQENIARFVSSKILGFLEQGSTSLSVNFPNLQLPELAGAHRLVHLHDNVPGILAQINHVLAEREINIIGQYLKTNEHVGYVITDVANDYDPGVVRELEGIPHTRRVRVLY
jgi:D-3-phosphoglycerate dehydrogenase / 2-oxoglutarate reductase